MRTLLILTALVITLSLASSCKKSSSNSCGTPSSHGSSALTSSGATLNWTAVAGATAYTVQYKVIGASVWTTATATTNSYTLTGLTAATTYQWQVQTVCSGGTSAATDTATFTTASVPYGSFTCKGITYTMDSDQASSPGIVWAYVQAGGNAVSASIQFSFYGGNAPTVGGNFTLVNAARGINATDQVAISVTVNQGTTQYFSLATSGTTTIPVTVSASGKLSIAASGVQLASQSSSDTAVVQFNLIQP